MKAGIKVEESGIIMVYLFINGRRFPVIVDDYLPVINGKLAFARSTSETLWPCFAEKALAKILGRYKLLEDIPGHVAMQYFTGVSTTVNTKDFLAGVQRVSATHFSAICSPKQQNSLFGKRRLQAQPAFKFIACHEFRT